MREIELGRKRGREMGPKMRTAPVSVSKKVKKKSLANPDKRENEQVQWFASG
jgi:hypothetical protein